MMRYLSAALSTSLALAGCATPPAPDNAQADVDHQILAAVQKIQAAQADLYQAGALNQATTKSPAVIEDDRQPITLSWQGDALQLLAKMAHDRGLGFSFMGSRMPLPVNIQVKGLAYDTVLQMVRAQVGYRADIETSADKLVLQYNRPKS